MLLVKFAHFFGLAMWLGGALTAMVLAMSTRGESADVRAVAYRLLARVHSAVIAPGALITVLSGLALTMSLATSGGGELLSTPRMMVMQGAGLLAGALVLFVGLPTAVKTARLAMVTEQGELPAEVEALRKRQAVVSSIAGVLVLLSLFFAVVVR